MCVYVVYRVASNVEVAKTLRRKRRNLRYYRANDGVSGRFIESPISIARLKNHEFPCVCEPRASKRFVIGLGYLSNGFSDDAFTTRSSRVRIRGPALSSRGRTRPYNRLQRVRDAHTHCTAMVTRRTYHRSIGITKRGSRNRFRKRSHRFWFCGSTIDHLEFS